MELIAVSTEGTGDVRGRVELTGDCGGQGWACRWPRWLGLSLPATKVALGWGWPQGDTLLPSTMSLA